MCLTSSQNAASDSRVRRRMQCKLHIIIPLNNPYNVIDESHQLTRKFITITVTKQRNVWSKAWFHLDNSCLATVLIFGDKFELRFTMTTVAKEQNSCPQWQICSCAPLTTVAKQQNTYPRWWTLSLHTRQRLLSNRTHVLDDKTDLALHDYSC